MPQNTLATFIEIFSVNDKSSGTHSLASTCNENRSRVVDGSGMIWFQSAIILTLFNISNHMTFLGPLGS